MVQPQYSPQEALERVKLMMKYDTSKTLNENKQMISEQYVAPTVAGAATGAALGAGAVAASTTTAGASVIVPVMSALGVGATAAGAIVGGAAGIALLPLVYWLVTKDTGANKVKKMFEMCSSESAKIAKLPRKMTDVTFRDMSDNIEDAINDKTLGFLPGTDEEKLFTQFKQLQDGTASDFCAFVKYYNSHSDSGDLFDDLDSDIDAEDEWKQIYRPIRNCVEDSLLTLKDENPVPEDPELKKKKKSGTGGYKACTGTYSMRCMTDPSGPIGKVQSCLDLVADGKYGPKTNAKLKELGYNSFKDSDVDTICNKKQPEVTPEVSGEDITIDTTDTNF
jgi:hypothetical protein